MRSMAGAILSGEDLAPALRGHELFSTTDPAVAIRLGAPLLGHHRFVVRDAECRFAASLHAVVAGPITLGHLHVAYEADLVVHASAPRILVAMPRRAGTGVRMGARSFVATPSTAAVIQPGRPATMLCPHDGASLVVGIEQQALVVHLSRLLGRALDRPLVFDPVLHLGGSAATRWKLAVEILEGELSERTSLLRCGIGSSQLEEFLMSSLLYGQRSTYTEVLSQPASPERRAVTTARDFIEANLPDRLTLGAVAAAAGVSVRTLQASFRSELRTTPTSYIRSRRLDRAHGDLSDPGSPAATVTDVATRWGITHLGRFAADYRTRYGETPSQTLRRQRR
jgi:AraC-like DNA-binding protein